MLNLCGIVVAILKMATGRNFSMSGINSGHHKLPTYEMALKSDNVEFVRFVVAILKMATGRNFSMSGHHYLPTHQMLMISDNVEFFHEILSSSSWDLPWTSSWSTERKKERKRRIIIIIIIIRNGAKTISLQMLFGRLNNNKKRSKNNKSPKLFGRLKYMVRKGRLWMYMKMRDNPTLHTDTN